MKSDNVDGFEEDGTMAETVRPGMVIRVSGEQCVCCGAMIPEGLQICPACSAVLKEDRMSTKNGVWHDVNLDPPTEEGSYLVATDNGGVMISHWYPLRTFNGVVTGGGFTGARGHITHWMNRPDPPGGRKEKKVHTFRDRQKPEIRQRNLQIWKLYQGGMTQREIARKYRIASSTVYFILKDIERMKKHGLI